MNLSRKEKEILYINAYMWNLEKRYWWTYFHRRNREANVENGLVNTLEKGEGGTKWESSIEIYTLPYVKQIAIGRLVYNIGSSAQCSVITWRGRREAQDGGDICILMADSCCGTAETNTTLQSNYLIIKNTFVKKIKKFEKKNC